MNEQPAGTSTGQARSLKATKILACRTCQAPGVYVASVTEAEAQHYSRWPAVVVAHADPLRGTPVGDTCPCCGADRRGLLQKLGIIWRGASDREVKGAS